MLVSNVSNVIQYCILYIVDQFTKAWFQKLF